MKVHEMMEQIERVAEAMMHNIEEAEEHIERAHKLRDVCRVEADWYKHMAEEHMEFNNSGKVLFDRLMADMSSHEDARPYLMGAEPIYARWMQGIMRSAARVHAMIQTYK